MDVSLRIPEASEISLTNATWGMETARKNDDPLRQRVEHLVIDGRVGLRCCLDALDISDLSSTHHELSTFAFPSSNRAR